MVTYVASMIRLAQKEDENLDVVNKSLEEKFKDKIGEGEDRRTAHFEIKGRQNPNGGDV